MTAFIMFVLNVALIITVNSNPFVFGKIEIEQKGAKM